MTEEVKLFNNFSLSAVSCKRPTIQGIRFIKVCFVVHNNIHLYGATTPSITKRNHGQLIFLDHFSNYHVTSSIKILLIRVNNIISWLICFLEFFPTAKQALACSLLLPDHIMATPCCFFLALAFYFLWQSRYLLVCP